MSEKVMIGKLIDGEAHRDAIHIAIAPVVVSHAMNPGEEVSFVTPSDCRLVAAGLANKIGIIDPFLKKALKANDRCYVFLYPNTITSLRHQWTHPAFPAAEPVSVQAKAEAVAWIEQFARDHGVSYDEMIEAADDWVRHEDYLIRGGQFEGCYVPEEFWNYYEHATGKIVPNEKRGSFFSCSC